VLVGVATAIHIRRQQMTRTPNGDTGTDPQIGSASHPSQAT
jgi:hypothetical protein